MISTRTAAIRFGISKTWSVKTAELGFFSANFEIKVRRFFYNFFAGPLVVGAGVALAGLILHRTVKTFIVEVFLQDSRLLDWWATRPGFRLRRIRKTGVGSTSVSYSRQLLPIAGRAYSAKLLRAGVASSYNTSSLFQRVSPPLRPYFYRRRVLQRMLGYSTFSKRSPVANSGLTPIDQSAHMMLRRKHRSLIKRNYRSLSRTTFFKFRGAIRSSIISYFRKRVGVERPYLRRRLRMFRRIRRFRRPRRRRFRRRRVRRLNRYWFIRHYASIYRRYRKLPLRSLKRTISSKFKRVRSRRFRLLKSKRRKHLRLKHARRVFRAMGKPLKRGYLVQMRRRLKQEQRKRRQKYRRRHRRQIKNQRFSTRQNRSRRRRVFRRATTRIRRRFFYRMPKFFRLRLFVFFARIAALMARKYFGIPVFIRLNFIGYRTTLDFYLNYITTKLYYRYILNDVIKPIVRLAATRYRGFRIVCNGRFTRAQMATTRIYRRGSLRSNMVSIPLAYGQRSVILKYGTCNLKIWLRY